MRFWNYIFIFLLLILSLLVIGLFQLPDDNLHVIACDVGQGDGLLIIYKNIQILTDGGPDNKVIGCLGRHIPFWDREIELVISTHPQKDHYSGLIEVFKRYKVDNILYNKVDVSTPDYQVLEKEVGSRGISVIRPHVGQVLKVGMIYLDILNPPDGFTDSNSNNIGIVDLLKYANFKAIFMADVENTVSDGLSTLSEIQGVNYIKVNHHGSKNGLTQNLLEKLVDGFHPEASGVVGVISVGKNNIYGHPHKEILDMLGKYNVKILRTDEMGDVDVVTDGERWWTR